MGNIFNLDMISILREKRRNLDIFMRWEALQHQDRGSVLVGCGPVISTIIITIQAGGHKRTKDKCGHLGPFLCILPILSI